MGPTKKGEATADRGGGLRARALAFLAHPALHRVVALTVGLGALGALGQCLGSTANALPAATTSPSASATTASVGRASDPPAAVAGSLATPSASVVPSPSTDPPAAGSGVVDLNAATIEELRRLPGIGPKRANAILELRAKLGSFKKLEDLLRVRGIGRAAIKRLRPLVAIGPSPPRT